MGGPAGIKAQGPKSGPPQAQNHEAGHCLCSAADPAGLGLAQGQPQLGGYFRVSRWKETMRCGRQGDLGLGSTLGAKKWHWGRTTRENWRTEWDDGDQVRFKCGQVQNV